MPERGVRKHLKQMQLPYWEYLGGEYLAAPSDTVLTVPSEASIIEIGAEAGVCYFDFGNAVANANSPGFIPSDGREILGPLVRNTIQSGIRIHAPGATAVHILYFREN